MIQFTLAWGFAGGIAMFVILGFAGRQAIGTRTEGKEANALVGITASAGIVVILVFGLVDGTLYHQVPLSMFLVFLALHASAARYQV